MKHFITTQIEKSISLKQGLLANKENIDTLIKIATDAVEKLKIGKKLIFAGNGSSAADSQHIVTQFISRYFFDRPGLRAIALNTDTAVMSALANDYGYELVYARQIEAIGYEGDFFFALSTSGNSANLVNAVDKCKTKGINTVGFLGNDGGRLKDLCDYSIVVPSKEAPRIQEVHLLLGHLLCSLIEEMMFGEGFE